MLALRSALFHRVIPSGLHGRFRLVRNMQWATGDVGTCKWAAIEAGKGSSLLAFYADHHAVPLPVGHRFPMEKYRATRLLLEDDLSLRNILLTKPAPMVSIEELCLVHEARYVERIIKGSLEKHEQQILGFPWSDELVGVP